MDELLPLTKVRAATSLGKTSIYTLIQQGGFPKPLRLSPRRVAWRTSDIQAWIAQQGDTRSAQIVAA